MNNYLPKPIPMEQLKSILETYTAQTIHTLHAPQIIETTAQTDELIAFKGLEEQFYGDKEAAAKMCLMDIKKQKWNEAHGQQLFLVFEQTMQAANGREALSLMQTKQFDLYLVDVMMPIMNGLEFLKELKERGITAPRIIASNYNEFDYVRQGMKLGAMDYLLKPVTEEELRECLQNVREELDEENEQNITEEIFRICGVDTTSGFARKVMAYFSEHVDLNLKDISDEFLLSHDYFGKLFKRQMNENFNTFAMRYKMEYAKYLLAHTDERIYEISDRLGYKTTDYFTKLFKEYTGETPAQYRKSGGDKC